MDGVNVWIAVSANHKTSKTNQSYTKKKFEPVSILDVSDLKFTLTPALDRGKRENTSTWCQALPGTPVCQFSRFVVTCRISVVFPKKRRYVFVSCFHHLNQ